MWARAAGCCYRCGRAFGSACTPGHALRHCSCTGREIALGWLLSLLVRRPPHLKFAALKAEPEELLGVVQPDALGLQEVKGGRGGKRGHWGGREGEMTAATVVALLRKKDAC